MSYCLLPEAVSDIESIALTIAAANPVAAQRWYDRLVKTFETLGDKPEMGAPRFDVRPDMRLLSVGNYLMCIERLTLWRRSCAVSMAHGIGKTRFEAQQFVPKGLE